MSTIQLKSDFSRLPHFRSTNQFDNSRKARGTRQRNTSSHLSVYQTPDHEPDSQALSSKALLDTNLPDIYSKKASRKRSSYLQMWLDQALDGQDGEGVREGPALRVQVDKTGPLRTVQKFQIDKKYLKSQNIAQEAIDKIYNSLYVYTYGINNTFEEILSLTKANEHVEKKIVSNFWRAFIRLLESCTSYRTTFQIVEETHLKTISELKENCLRREQDWLNDKKNLEEEYMKLFKTISEQSYNLSKITNDYNISEATLQLTDQAFNNEVSLRLKFQEKVNSMFTSYDELRNKYDFLLNDLRAKDSEYIEFKRAESKLSHQLEQTIIKLNQTKRQLDRAEEVIAERDTELALKRQDIYQLQGQVKRVMDEKEQNQEEVRKIVNKANSYRQQSEEYKAEAQARTSIIIQLQKRSIQHDQIMSKCREANQRLYKKLQEQGSTFSSLQNQLAEIQASLHQVKVEKQQYLIQIGEVQVANNMLLLESEELKKQISMLKGELAIKNNQIGHNTETITDLQAVNSKFQSLYKSLSVQKAKLQVQMDEVLKVSESFKEGMLGMKMLLENKTTQFQQTNIKLENQRQVFRTRIVGLRQEVETKEQQILELHNKQMEDQDALKAAQKIAYTAVQTVQNLQRDKLNLEAERLQTTMRFGSLDQERRTKNDIVLRYQEQIQELRQQLYQSKQTLLQKQEIINMGNNYLEQEGQHLRRMLHQYRETREKKVGYVHPMILQDCLEQINRMGIHIQQLNMQLQTKMSKIGAQLSQSKKDGQQKKQRISNLVKILAERQSTISTMKKSKSQIELVFNKSINQLNQTQAKLDKIRKQYNQLFGKNQQLLRKIQDLQQYRKLNIITMQEQSKKLKNLKQENKQLCQMIRDKDGQIKIAKQQITHLQEQAQRASNSRASSRNQPLSRKKISRQPQKQQKQKQQPKNEGSLLIIQQTRKQALSENEIIPSVSLKHETADKQVQTQKKSVHAQKFQPQQIVENKKEPPQAKYQSLGLAQKLQLEQDIHAGRCKQTGRKIDPEQYKRALKFTYMRH